MAEGKVEIAPGIYAEVTGDNPKTVMLTNLTGNLDVELTQDEKMILEELLSD